MIGYTLTTLRNSNLRLKTDLRMPDAPYNGSTGLRSLLRKASDSQELQDRFCLVLKTMRN